MNNKPLEILKKYFGYDTFRDPQGGVIDSVLNGIDTLALAATGTGKALHKDTIVQKADGSSTTMGLVRIGDLVLGKDGKATKVLAKFQPIVPDHYEITFKCGMKVKACGDHLWYVKVGNRQEKVYNTRVLNTLISTGTSISAPLVEGRRHTFDRHYISSIQMITENPEDFYCITVDNQDKLYVITEQFIPTHNTVMFQVPALCLDGLTVVISPLKSLQKDQVDNCIAKGIPVALVNSDTGKRERAKIIKALSEKTLKILYVSPETLFGENFSDILPLLTDVKLLAVDEAHCCFRKETELQTSYGKVSFEVLYNMFVNGAKLPLIRSYNESSKEIEWKPITNVFKNPFKQMQKITFESTAGSVESTVDHIFFTERGEVEAQSLVVGDKVLNFSTERAKNLTKDQLSFVVGSVLGDGGIQCLKESTYTHRLKFTHGIAQKPYLEWKNNLLGYTTSQDILENGFSKKPAVTCSSFSFFLKENVYPVTRGTRRAPFSASFLQSIDEKALSVWYMDDGSLYKSKKGDAGSITISCCSFSKELCLQLIDYIKDRWNITMTLSLSNHKHYFLRINRENTFAFLNLISKYVHPNLAYKILDSSLIDTSSWSLDKVELPTSVTVVKNKVAKNQQQDFLYDIEVQDNHNYFVYTKTASSNSSKNAVLVHNCSAWSDFRPKYRELYKARENFFPNATLVAVTATADEAVVNDIKKYLGFNKNHNFFKTTFDRPTISYEILKVSNNQSFTVAAKIIKERHLGQAGILFCGTQKKCEEVATFLKALGFKAKYYHAKLKKSEKESIQDEYLSGKIDIICATIAFGMGIDKPDIRFVIHLDAPSNFDDYSQQVGRASRDRLPSTAYMLYDPSSYRASLWLIQKSTLNPERLQVKVKKLKEFHEYCKSNACRRKTMLAYFGETYPKSNCGSCDICKGHSV